MWWQSAWPIWADYKGAEKLATRQRIRKIVFTLAIIVGAALGGKKVWERRLFQQLGARAVGLAATVAATGAVLKDRAVALLPGN
jgi:hypothetical protein